MEGSFSDILLLMMVAVVAVWIFKRINLPPILAYLFCGIVAGPDLMHIYGDPEDMHFFAELGIVFLLFSLGLEFSLPKMLAMRHLVFGIGLGQTVITTLVFMGLAMLFGFGPIPAFVMGSMAALSSTAIVIKQSSELGILNTSRAQMSISILLFQDIAVVPILIVIPLFAAGGEQSLAVAIALAVFKGSLVLIILLSVGKWGLPRIFNEVAKTRTDELFVLTTILVALMAAGLTHSFGLSMALGAFLAGMMLGESQYKHQLEADIRPFRDIFMGLFFITIGMRLELDMFVSSLHWIIIGLVVLMVLKVLLVRFVAWLLKASGDDAWASGIKLSQMGEFSFIIVALATDHSILDAQIASILMSIGILSMAITPWLVTNSQMLVGKITSSKVESPEQQQVSDEALKDHVIIFGFGRVGQSVSRLLRMEAIKYIAVDADPVRVQESRSAGEVVFFGDVQSKDILRSVGIDNAKLVILTFDEPTKAKHVVETVTALNPDLHIVVRTRKDYHLEELYLAGASQVVPEILEGSLMLVSQVLHLCGVPMSRILKRVRKERKAHYQHMHGFYPGETTEMTYGKQDKLEFMHAVVLTPDAHAVGKKLQDVKIDSMRVAIKGLRRDNAEIPNPDENTVLQINDVIVISGKPRRVERAERILLEGH